MDEVVERRKLVAALKRVRQNQGRPGIDGMTVEERPRDLAVHWVALRAQRLAGTSQPQPVRRQAMPKAGGGVRALGMPTARDRVLPQAILQVLPPRVDPTFSEPSYGFRPGCYENLL